MMRFVIFKSTRNLKYYFHLQSRNGKFTAQSQPYATKYGATKTATRIRGVNYSWLITEAKPKPHKLVD